MNTDSEPRRADQVRTKLIFSICTLVTNKVEYTQMVESFRAGGFDGPDCEYLYLDNTSDNAFDAFRGGNIFLREAAGSFIILCHQDVLLLKDDRKTLEIRLAELDALDTKWALCGNGGGTVSGDFVIRVSDPHGENQALGTFPSPITALDENFIVVRRDANLSLSHDLYGFHFHGTDLCILADVVGRSAWVIDFHLRHKSAGRYEPAFFEAIHALEDKYRKAFRPRLITSTCTTLRLSKSGIHRRLEPLLLAYRAFRRMLTRRFLGSF